MLHYLNYSINVFQVLARFYVFYTLGCCQTSVTCELSIHTPFRELCPKFVDARKSKGQEKALQNKRFMTPWANYVCSIFSI